MLKIISWHLLICPLKISAILKWYKHTLQKHEKNGLVTKHVWWKSAWTQINLSNYTVLFVKYDHLQKKSRTALVSMRDNLTSTTSLCLIICHHYDNPMNQANPLMKSVYRSESFSSFPNGLCLPLDVASTSHPVTRSSNHNGDNSNNDEIMME